MRMLQAFNGLIARYLWEYLFMDNLRADSNGSFLQQGINRTGILVASSSAKRQKLYRLLPLSDSSLGYNVVF